MPKQHSGYLVFMLRLWQTTEDHCQPGSFDQTPVWRALLEDPYTRERIGFASLEGLFDFLRAQAGLIGPRDPVQFLDTQKEQQR